MKKIWTTDDLAEGKVVVENNGSLELLKKILKAAFPKDLGHVGGVRTFYARMDTDKNKWIAISNPRLPIVKATDIIIKNSTMTPKNEFQYATRAQVKTIIDIACGEWKVKLSSHINGFPFEDKIPFSEEDIIQMFKAATVRNSIDQRKVLLKIFTEPLPEKDMTLLENMKKESGMDYFTDTGMITPRTGGSLAGRAFYLSKRFTWEIVEDTSGNKCLVPKIK